MARPTHRLKADGSLVFPQGYAPGDIEALPADYYKAGDLAAVEAGLIADIDHKREVLRAMVMTPGVGQSYAYAQKASEVYDYRNIVGALLAGLTMPQKTARYPFAMAEATATGDTLAVVIARFEAGMSTSRSRIAHVEAVATKAKREIRAAATIAAKRAAFAAIDWT
ncbi:MAG: hypothetical protein H2050_15850 [Sphingobium sp.]|uniref:hypothetical protein n=1 Tax=Sphingobium sp. TaxID=1912891 RepID=UPI00183A6464|nr:hypothetical protein [Sphingobium sp.]MBA4756300.1 hypothetical protein [Sphingobium sp.]